MQIRSVADRIRFIFSVDRCCRGAKDEKFFSTGWPTGFLSENSDRPRPGAVLDRSEVDLKNPDAFGLAVRWGSYIPWRSS